MDLVEVRPSSAALFGITSLLPLLPHPKLLKKPHGEEKVYTQRCSDFKRLGPLRGPLRGRAGETRGRAGGEVGWHQASVGLRVLKGCTRRAKTW